MSSASMTLRDLSNAKQNKHNLKLVAAVYRREVQKRLKKYIDKTSRKLNTIIYEEKTDIL